MNQGKQHVSILTAVLVGVAAAGSVNAQTALHIDYDTAYQGNVSVAGYFGPEDVYLTPFQATYVSGTPLPFPTTNPFNTFCVDISPILNPNGTWTSGPLPLGANGNAIPYLPGGIQTAASIYNAYVGNVSISTASGQLWGAALQVAIWSDLYGSAFSLTSDGHDISDVQSLASIILSSPNNIANPGLTSTFWNATDPAVNQDLIGPQMGFGFVPEPGIFTVAASACALLGLLGFRRRQALG